MKQSVLIVGGSTGIGCALAQSLQDADIHIIDIKPLSPSLVVNNIQFTQLDITYRQNVRDLIASFQQKGMQFDAVVMSVGCHSTHPIEFMPDEVFDKVMDINFLAHAKFVRDIIPLVKTGGKIIGVSSIGATLGIPMSSMYSASKGALELFYESLRTELSYKSIWPVIIQPGNVNTGFNETGNTYTASSDSFVDRSYKHVVQAIDSSKGMSPTCVASVIKKAINSSHPKLCYIVGMNALKAFWARRLLGRQIAVKLMAKFFGI